MAFYSFGRIKIISRNGIKSAVATAAYHAGIKIKNEYDGVTHDYCNKKYVKETYVRMPDSVPMSWRDESVPAKERIGIIWNDIEKVNPTANARLARSNYIALPHDLSTEQGLECVDRWIQENCTSKGMGVTYTLHDQPGNRHVDVMYLVSEYDQGGKPKEKSKKEYLCRDKDGNECYMDAEALKMASKYEKVYRYQKGTEKANMTPSEANERPEWERINKYPVSRKVKVSGWDDKELAKTWRKSWEVILNSKYEELGMKDRVDSRSYADRGISQLPTIHEGWGSDKDVKREYNNQVKEFNKDLKQLYREGKAAIIDSRNQIVELRDTPQTQESLDGHEHRYELNERKIAAIADSGLFSPSLTKAFKHELARLSQAMREVISWCRESLVREKGWNRKPAEPVKKAEKTVDIMRRNLDDILAEATQKVKSKKQNKREDLER